MHFVAAVAPLQIMNEIILFGEGTLQVLMLISFPGLPSWMSNKYRSAPIPGGRRSAVSWLRGIVGSSYALGSVTPEV